MALNLTPILVLIVFFAPKIGWSQTQLPDKPEPQADIQLSTQGNPVPADSSNSNTPPTPSQAPAPADENTGSEAQQTKRMFWVVPNFRAVNPDTTLPPMSPRQKFVLASHDSFADYSGFAWTAIIAGQAMLSNSDPEFGQGIAGYGRYYWHNFVDGVSGTFFTEAIVPTISREDPRYYTLGKGSFFHRTAYAISRAFITKMDSGGNGFNWSEVGGNGLEAGLSNAYYPAQERVLKQTAQNWGIQMESAVLNHIFQEFWPDIHRKLTGRK